MLQCRANAVKANAFAAAKTRAAIAEADAQSQAMSDALTDGWHDGYTPQDDNVYWEWRNDLGCKDYASNGCWHIAVITRDGCPNYVAANEDEYRGAAVINQLLDNQSYGIPPQTVRIFESDRSAAETDIDHVTIDCS